MSKKRKKRSEQQIYGRNDMVNIEPNKKIYGSLGKTEKWFWNTVEGNPVIMSNSREGSFEKETSEFSLYGWSKQKTTTGAQLFNKAEVKSGYFQQHNLDTGALTIVVSAAHWITGYIALEENKQYTTNIDAPVGVFYDAYKNPIATNILYNQKTFTTPENTAYLVMTFEENVYSISNAETIILNAGATIKTYEDYTGGKPSPSPDYPQEIESTGDDGKIGLSVHGKNLFDLEYALQVSNWHSVGTGYFYIPYYVGKGNIVSVSCKNKLPAGFDAYICIGRDKGSTNGAYMWIYHSTSTSLINNKGSFAIVNDYIYLNCAGDYIKTLKQMEDLQIEVSSAPTAYEPYRTPQSTAIITPSGLPGIPVPSNTAGITYTDASGQAWIADEVDLERGKYVQRVWKGVFDGSSDEEWHSQDDIKSFWISILPEKMYARKGFVNQYEIVNNYENIGIFLGGNNRALSAVQNVFYDTSLGDKGLSNFKSHLAANPLTVMTYLDTPIERDLTSAELAEYTQLYSYKPTTVVENDSDVHMKLTYRATGN